MASNQFEERNKILIKKNTAIPCEDVQMTGSRIDNQSDVLFRVTQGESEDVDMVSVIATVSVPLPHGMPAGTPIKVKFKYDINQCMHCSFIIAGHENGKEIDLDLNRLS